MTDAVKNALFWGGGIIGAAIGLWIATMIVTSFTCTYFGNWCGIPQPARQYGGGAPGYHFVHPGSQGGGVQRGPQGPSYIERPKPHINAYRCVQNGVPGWCVN